MDILPLITIESLLNKFSEVSPDGHFSSPISNPEVRFATAIGGLAEGRISVANTSQVNGFLNRQCWLMLWL